MIKGEEMNVARVLLSGYLFLVMVLCVNMGENKKQNTLELVRYHQLKEKEGCYHATIHDAGNKIEVRNFSFAGYTTLGGVLKETDDSVNRLDLSEIKEIIVTNQFYTGQRYKNLELLQAEITTKNNKRINDLLIPRHIEISGIEISTQIQKAWDFSKVEKVIIQGPCNHINEEAEARKFTEAHKTRETPKAEPLLQRTQHNNGMDIIPVTETETKNLQTPIKAMPEPMAPPSTEHHGILRSIFNLFDAILGIFKALVRTVSGLFGFH